MDSAEPADLSSGRITQLLRSYWQLEVDRVTYARVGHGSYHWIGYQGDAATWFRHR